MILMMLACASDIRDLTLEPGEIGTVVTAAWWSPLKAEGQVVYQTPAGLKTMPAQRRVEGSGFAYTAQVLGLTSDATTSGQVQLLDAGGALLAEEDVTIEAGRLNMVLPEVSLTTLSHAPDGYLMTSFMKDPAAAVILDQQGDVIWGVYGEEVIISRTLLHPDGRVVFAEYGNDEPEDEATSDRDSIVFVSLDGRQQKRVSTPGLHHDFTLLPDGTVAYIAHDIREVDGELVRGDRIMELVGDEEPVEVWSAWEVVPYLEDTPSTADGWTHANALDYDPHSDAYLLSLHNYNAILSIDRATGLTRWTLGGPYSDFVLPEHATFRRQHQFQLLDDSLLVFDNGSTTEGISEVHELRLDEAAGTVEQIWHYAPQDSVYTMMFGDVSRQPDDDTIINFCASGLVERVGPDGDVRWRMETPFGSGLGYFLWMEEPADFLP